MTSNRLPVLGPHGFFRIAWREWGDPSNGRVLFCVPGLTRNSRDFEVIGRALAPSWRVVAVDLPGRGLSNSLPDADDYAVPTYATACAAMLGRLAEADELVWLGTSLGGIVGMLVAAQPNTPINRLILNDVGPVIPAAGINRIAAYVRPEARFVRIEDAMEAMRESSKSFGVHTDAALREHVEASLRPDPLGGFGMDYDPNVALSFAATQPKQDLSNWPLWEAITIPTLVLRGAESDLLRADTAAEMLTRRPATKLVEFAGVAHAPRLADEGQIKVVRDWLG